MKRTGFEDMSVDELWDVHKKLSSLLTQKIVAERRQLQKRLDALARNAKSQKKARRPYPKVPAKFQNPNEPSQTWAGRGKQPHWVSEMLNAGKSMDDLRIPETA
jgi:DNA-binding protein H-NS